MKQLLLLLVITFTCRSLSAQEVVPDTAMLACSYNCDNTLEYLLSKCFDKLGVIRREPIPVKNINPYKEFDSIISTLHGVDGNKDYPLTYIFTECPATCNAASITANTGQYIFYSHAFLNQLISIDQSLLWAVRGIIAHEIGHHVLGHTAMNKNMNYTQRQKMELEADLFSGTVMKLFEGCTVENSIAGLKSIDNDAYTPKNDEEAKRDYYPLIATRYKAVQEGYNTASNTPVKLSMFKKIDSIAQDNFTKFGESTILSIVDRDIAFNRFPEAKEAIRKFMDKNPGVIKSDLLKKVEQYEKEAYKKDNYNTNNDPIGFPIDKDELIELQKLYDKMIREGNPEDRKAIEALKKKIEKLKNERTQVVI
jgi:hypothetical protein